MANRQDGAICCWPFASSSPAKPFWGSVPVKRALRRMGPRSWFGKKIPKKILESQHTKDHSKIYGKLGWQRMFNNDDMRYGKPVNHSAPKHLGLGHPKKNVPTIRRQENVAIFSCRCFLYFGSMCQLLYSQVKYLGWKESEGPCDDQFWHPKMRDDGSPKKKESDFCPAKSMGLWMDIRKDLMRNIRVAKLLGNSSLVLHTFSTFWKNDLL